MLDRFFISNYGIGSSSKKVKQKEIEREIRNAQTYEAQMAEIAARKRDRMKNIKIEEIIDTSLLDEIVNEIDHENLWRKDLLELEYSEWVILDELTSDNEANQPDTMTI